MKVSISKQLLKNRPSFVLNECRLNAIWVTIKFSLIFLGVFLSVKLSLTLETSVVQFPLDRYHFATLHCGTGDKSLSSPRFAPSFWACTHLQLGRQTEGIEKRARVFD